jgi:DNA-binding NtrC family response regulator
MRKSAILIVEDEPSVLDALSVILKDGGYRTSCACTGLAGIKEASRLRFDLAIIDVRLPDISGLKVLECLLQTSPDLAAIIISAYDIPELVEEAARRAVIGTLAKPFLRSALLDVVHAGLSGR